MKSCLTSRLSRPCLLILTCIVLGCDSETLQTPSGTPGMLLAGTHPLKDVQVTIYTEESIRGAEPEPLAFGITDEGGRFSLQRHESLAGFQLPEGSYRVTLESVGEFQLIWPPDYRSPHKTPLRRSWTPDTSELVLDVPEPDIVL